VSGLISNKELAEKLRYHVPTCTELNIISAFVTKPAVDWLCKLIEKKFPKVCVVGRFSPADFIAGASDLNALKQCIIRGIEIRALPNLHAKIYQIDKALIYTGSANLTGKGLALVEEGNLESCSKVHPSEDSIAFIEKIIDAASILSSGTLEKMQKFIGEQSSPEKSSAPKWWPEAIIPVCRELFVSDFPLSQPGETSSAYIHNPSLEFAIIEANQETFHIAKEQFKCSKAYNWLKGIVLENTSERGLGFGAISSKLHDYLSDDPAPVRREIKD